MVRNLSILLPHFQKQKTLNNVVESLILQIHPDDEILIIDDNSPDGVPEFTCPCTRVITPPKLNPHIYRLCTLRNVGISEARHDAVIILDPDCIPNPYFLDNARRLFDPSILYGGCIDKEYSPGGVVVPDSRRNSGRSYWADWKDKDGGGIWGGCMMFSKSRTSLVGWFSEDFNGTWGAEELEFASRCYHSGMRLRYSMELQVTHLWHPKQDEGKEVNRELWKKKVKWHKTNLDNFTPYRPAVGVMVITMMRPELINQCLQAVFRNRVAMKVRLINNGDEGEQTRKICEQWGRRYAVDYVKHERKWPAVVRNESMRWAKENGFKYLVFIDDDMLVNQSGIVNLVRSIENHPEYYAMSGVLKGSKGIPERMIGGLLQDDAFWNLPKKPGVQEADWVGGGFTIHKVDPLIPYDEQYQTGYNDFDWCMQVKQEGLRLGLTGSATAYHGYRLTSDGLEKHRNSAEYNALRYDQERHTRMRELFRSKWNFGIGKGGLYSE